MEKLKRGDKIYLDENQKKESEVNYFLDCRDGIVELYEYRDNAGYGSKTRLFLCNDTKHESVALIRQTYNDMSKEWMEESMYFDSDSYEYLEALINKESIVGGEFSLVRDIKPITTITDKEKIELLKDCFESVIWKLIEDNAIRPPTPEKLSSSNMRSDYLDDLFEDGGSPNN